MILLLNANALHIPLADESVNCAVTSPPYYGLRDYGTAAWEGGDTECNHEAAKIKTRFDYDLADKQASNNGSNVSQYKNTCPTCGAIRVDNQIGLEETPEEYVSKLVAVFREVRRVLSSDGVCWLNLGDSYAGSGGPGSQYDTLRKNGYGKHFSKYDNPNRKINGLKPKDLIGIPWLVAFALRADGWYLRSDIIWHKPNPMPESVTDRPTKSHEYIFLLSKSATYYYDYEAILEPVTGTTHARVSQNVIKQVGSFRANGGGKTNGPMKAVIRTPKQQPAGSGIKNNDSFNNALVLPVTERNKRSVWTVATQPYSGAHFATFPPALIEPCIKAGTSEKGKCPKCGQLWVRVTEKTGEYTTQWGSNLNLEKQNSYPDSMRGTNQSRKPKMMVGIHSTIGWRAQCDCGEEPVPCIVFDPFAGSGTTMQVARKLHRYSVGCDLSLSYLRDCAVPRLQLSTDEFYNGKKASSNLDGLPLFSEMD